MVQGVLSATGELLGAAGGCVDAAAGGSEEGFQGAGPASCGYARADRTELPVSLHVYGNCSVHYARHLGLLPGGKRNPP